MRLKLMTLCMALCCLCLNAFAQNVPDYVPTEGLVAWYPFNGNASDESGNEQDGEIVGAQLTVDRFGLSESAYSFDHTRIEIENSATNDQFKTISFWFMSSSPGIQVAFKQNIYVGHGYERVSCAIQWNGTHFAGKEVCNAAWQYDNVGGDVNDGIWHHYVGILDSTQKRLYIDGTFLDESEFNPENMCSGGDLIIGQEWDGVPYDFIGDLDDFGFWDRALTEEEIQALYNAPALVPGCTESTACNFNEEANIEDDSCVYPLFGEDCETGGAACGEGTIWDSSLQSCVGFDECPSDLNDDGIVGINDLLSLLSDFGMECPPEMAEWTCGD
ncbi:LamG domain-containing protein, partial [Flavobacteriales bacterium]|nr:LamG domain-containing protein [Flavobacteriales bacterium]